jgi:hypothetical protein
MPKHHVAMDSNGVTGATFDTPDFEREYPRNIPKIVRVVEKRTIRKLSSKALSERTSLTLISIGTTAPVVSPP